MERRNDNLEAKGKRVDSIPTNDDVTVDSSDEKGGDNRKTTEKGFLEYQKRSW